MRPSTAWATRSGAGGGALLDAAGILTRSQTSCVSSIQPIRAWSTWCQDIEAAAREVGLTASTSTSTDTQRQPSAPTARLSTVASFDTPHPRGARGRAGRDARVQQRQISPRGPRLRPSGRGLHRALGTVTTYGALARVATRARLIGGGKPVVLAAYQSIYDKAARDAADVSTRLTMATLFLAWRHPARRRGWPPLVDLYVRNMPAEDETSTCLRTGTTSSSRTTRSSGSGGLLT